MKHVVTTEQLHDAVGPFFKTAKCIEDTLRNRFAAFTGASKIMLFDVFPRRVWNQKRDEWVLSILRPAMDEAFHAVRMREEFTSTEILKRVVGAQINISTFERVGRSEWRNLAAKLPTKRDFLLKKIEEWVATRKPIEEVSIGSLLRETGVCIKRGPWLRNAIRSARRELLKANTEVISDGERAGSWLEFNGIQVDLDADEWRFNPYCETVRRSRLRNDIAGIGWPFLREELKLRTSKIRTIAMHYKAFRWAGELLGDAVPDLRAAKLKAVQKAWNSSASTGSKLRQTHWALLHLFTYLHHLSREDTTIDHSEFSRIVVWLTSQATFTTNRRNKDFLTEEELNTVVNCCLTDIEAGIIYVEGNPDLLGASTLVGEAESAIPVVHWGLALMVLLMTFTGLRPQSVIRLKVNEWMQLFPKVNVLAWQHDKKGEANIVAIPALLARLLNLYVKHTDVIRRELGTNLVFLTSDMLVQWRYFDEGVKLLPRIDKFVERHNIVRDGSPLHITPTMLRRTYVTHQLYKGRSIFFVRAQLGHGQVKSTLSYAQQDRFEHPAQVGAALDEYGCRVLDLWHAPVNIAAISSQARAVLFTSGIDQGKTIEDSPVPCAVCDRLHTGPEFLSEWEAELEIRTRHLSEMETDPSLSDLFVKERAEHAAFLTNFECVKNGAAACE